MATIRPAYLTNVPKPKKKELKKEAKLKTRSHGTLLQKAAKAGSRVARAGGAIGRGTRAMSPLGYISMYQDFKKAMDYSKRLPKT